MAGTSSGNDKEEDFLVCGICMEYYDVEGRTPKLLACFHSCCIACLKLQAETSIVRCPYCRQVTLIRNGVDKLATNFYIVPQVQKMVAKRKTVDDMLAKTKDNLAESIARRRHVQLKLKMVENGLKMMENSIIQRTEENNEKIAILQSLLEDPFLKQDKEELLASYSKCETHHQYSKDELAAADILGCSLSDVANSMCSFM